MVEAPSRISQRPTSVDPVKLILATFGLWLNSVPMSLALPVTTWKTPAGIPARSASTPRERAESGVCEAGLTMMVHPAARAGPAFLVIMPFGKFQGVIAAQTPTGCFMTRTRRSAPGGGTMSP